MTLLALCIVPAYFTAWFRIDSPEDLVFVRVWDITLGLALAVAVLLLCVGTKSRKFVFGLAAAAWLFISGCFLVWHEVQVRVRWTVSPRTLAANQVRMAEVALEEYARDCGTLPTAEKGLAALVTHSGAADWAGPYLEVERLTDPWGNPLQFAVRGDRAEVWSMGPDGQSGTEDDIRREVVKVGLMQN